MAQKGKENPPQRDSNADYFPTLNEALAKLKATTNAGEERISRLDLRFDASGYGFYRYWVGRDTEHGVGSIARD